MRIIVLGILALFIGGAQTSQVNTYINGNVLTATQLNSEFSNIYNTVNALDEANMSSSMALEPTKISATIDGTGIIRQADGSLDVQVDGTTVKIVSDVVQIVDLPGSALATGAITTTQILDGDVKKVDLEIKTSSITATAGNVALSNGTGAALVTHVTGTSGDLVNNLVNITTLGGPVLISIVPGDDTTNSYIECEDATTDPCFLELARGGSNVVTIPFFSEGNIYRVPPGAFNFIDVVGAGTYEYKIRYSVPSATALRVLNVRLMAHEL